jgi:hypothetical protein
MSDIEQCAENRLKQLAATCAGKEGAKRAASIVHVFVLNWKANINTKADTENEPQYDAGH